jgi:hypothetical protein
MIGGIRGSRLVALLAALCVSLTSVAAAAAATPIAPWDGQNPFRCTVQDVGSGTDFPDPDVDPFCVEFDKTSQNLIELGLVEFLTLEPARVAAAVPKCFYHQEDHWTGSVVQGQPPELWHWDGSYYFDKARGTGGVYVENLRIGGMTADPRLLPGFPTAWWPYFGPGRGGVQLVGQGIPVDPACAARVDTPAEARRVYRRYGGSR